MIPSYSFSAQHIFSVKSILGLDFLFAGFVFCYALIETSLNFAGKIRHLPAGNSLQVPVVANVLDVVVLAAVKVKKSLGNQRFALFFLYCEVFCTSQCKHVSESYHKSSELAIFSSGEIIPNRALKWVSMAFIVDKRETPCYTAGRGY